MNVVFRVDASKNLGAGHLVRCINLAEAIRAFGAKILFICRDSPDKIYNQLIGNKFDIMVLPMALSQTTSQLQDAQETIQVINSLLPDWLIVDSYSLDEEWELLLRPYVRKLMVIDDQPNRKHDCDLLLDQNYSLAGEDRYYGRVPTYCRTMLGPKYALLSENFRRARLQLPEKKGLLKNLLIFFTAGNDQNETLKAMQGVAQFGKVAGVDVVIGSANKDKKDIEKMCLQNGWSYHCQVNNMHELLANADLSIGASGISNWERCALGVPALVVVLAENQTLITRDLANAGAIINLGKSSEMHPDFYARQLAVMTSELLLPMSETALQLVDGLGQNRVAEYICNC